tara:strand:- start:514 stop:1182 length:669 start_codon:yes stop_codon:yes gene_type:complete
MAEIITLQNNTEIKNYPSFHNNWTINFNTLKEKFNWVIENDISMIQEPFIHEYFNELNMRTCLPRRVCEQYHNDLFATCHRVHLLESQKSRILLTEGYWVEQADYPAWAEDGIFIIAKSVWITEDGIDTTNFFDEYEEFYFRCPSNIASNSYGHTVDDNNDTILLSALVKTDGTVIAYRKHKTNTDIEDNEFLDNWAAVYVAFARSQNKKQFAKNLFASGLV